MGNDSRYNNSLCFDPFPFPAATDDQRVRIRALGEQLDAHRKRQQAAYPDLTITGMYNVLQKLRSGEPLTAKDRVIHEHGLVSVLKQIHDELDAAVFDAYGWPHDLTDEQILERLVALNAERAAEERRGIIRWLRPEYQRGAATGADSGALDLEESAESKPAPAAVQRWPKTLSDQVTAVLAAVASSGVADAKSLAREFKGAKAEKTAEVLDALATIGRVHRLSDGRFAIVAA